MSKHLDPTRLDDRRIRANVAKRAPVDIAARVRAMRQADTQKMLDRYRASVVS